jgi:2-methylisocitrate lyase-like PEP mutase family enzyme
MNNLSRRDFGKKISAGALGGMAASSVAPLAWGEGASSQSSKQMSTVLREMIKSPGIIDRASVHDPISARIAECVGFRCVNMGGYAVGASMCVPEPILSLEDMAEVTRRITAAVNIPLIVDAGAGYGEPAHVVHTVRVFERAGAAGLHIEDQIYPKRFHYHMGVEHTIPFEAMLEKIRYACKARRDPDFVIVARTDAMRTHSFAEGVRRANLYAEAGADFILVYPNNVEEAKRAPKEIHAPLNYTNSEGNAQGRPVFSTQELEAMGYKVVGHAASLILPSVKALKDTFVRLKQTGSSGLDPAVYIPLRKEIEEMIGLPEYYRIENETTEKA